MDPWLFRRISVRYLAAGQASDVIGRVIHRTDAEVQLMRRNGQIEIVPVDDIIAARDVPDTERRLRGPAETSIEALNALIDRVADSQAEPVSTTDARPRETAQRVFAADMRDRTDSPKTAPKVVLLEQPDAIWLASARLQTPGEYEVDSMRPEPTRAFLRIDDITIARVVLCGDWFALDRLWLDRSRIPAADLEALVAALVSAASAWATARGAFFAWALVAHDDAELTRAFSAIGFNEHYVRDSAATNRRDL